MAGIERRKPLPGEFESPLELKAKLLSAGFRVREGFFTLPTC